MAHWKKISPHILQPTDTNPASTPTTRHAVVNHPRLLTESKTLSEKNAIRTPLIQTPPTESIPQVECIVIDKYADSQTEEEAETTKTLQIQRLANIRMSHEHDVLMGRGNTKYLPGNQFFRNLIRKHCKHYGSSCKDEKGIFATLIMDEG